HGWAFRDHEEEAAALAKEIGFAQISVSHKVSPLVKLVGRGDTCVVDAYLSPILRRYVDQVRQELGVQGSSDNRLQFMMSSGGLTAADRFEGKDAILSGPAGGVVGMVETAREEGFDQVIGFDMGGTSTDVAHHADGYERAFDTEVAGVRIRAPMMMIHTVAAGGGSILKFEDARFQVGPDSAGANPGPASYRRGGPLTVTDANVMVGKLDPASFPAIFGPDRDQPLDAQIVRSKFDALAKQVGDGRKPEEIAEGFLKIAVQNMANAIKKISVQRGYDVTRYLLNCFGGAGGQHACLVADALGMDSILIHPLSGLLSAYGIGMAKVSASRQHALVQPLHEDRLAEITSLLSRLRTEVEADLQSQGVPSSQIDSSATLHVRYDGTDTTIEVPFGGKTHASAKAFEEAHKAQFGFNSPGRRLIVEAVGVEGVAQGSKNAAAIPSELTEHQAETAESRLVYAHGSWHDTAVFDRTKLSAGAIIESPAIIVEPNQTIMVEPGWTATLTARDNIVMRRTSARTDAAPIGTNADPVMLEVFNNLFMSIAEQMGV
ncbi:MAG: hydantoinase/oxoprolinase family protein, partial [Pseudomonadota bacterium]